MSVIQIIQIKLLRVLLFIALVISVVWWNYADYNNFDKIVHVGSKEVMEAAQPIRALSVGSSNDFQERENANTKDAFQKALEQSASNPVISQPNQCPDLVSALQEIQRIQLKDARVSPFAEMKKE